MSHFTDIVSSFIKERGYKIYSFSEIHNGVISNVTITPANPCQNSYSVAKAFTVSALGLLYDRGLISTEEKIVDILRDEMDEEAIQKMDKRWATVTVEDALLHRLGLPKNFLDIDCNDPRKFGKDYLAYTLTYPLVGDHGGERTYTDAAYYLLARVIEKRAGVPLDALLWEGILFPLGVKEAAFSKCPMGHAMGATGLYIRSDDMAKLGALYLGNGKYEGSRILSEEWVKTVLSRGYELRLGGYGEGYCKGGMLGQMLYVFPKQDRVIAWHGYGFKEKDELLYFISQYKD